MFIIVTINKGNYKHSCIKHREAEILVVEVSKMKKKPNPQNEEFAQDLSPDDLDTRNDKDMTKEQKENTPLKNTPKNPSQ